MREVPSPGATIRVPTVPREDEAVNFAIEHGEMIGAIFGVILIVVLLKYFWSSTAIKFLLAIVVGGLIVWMVSK